MTLKTYKLIDNTLKYTAVIGLCLYIFSFLAFIIGNETLHSVAPLFNKQQLDVFFWMFIASGVVLITLSMVAQYLRFFVTIDKRFQPN